MISIAVADDYSRYLIDTMRPSSFVSLQKLQQQFIWNEHFQGSTVEQSLEKKKDSHTMKFFFADYFAISIR